MCEELASHGYCVVAFDHTFCSLYSYLPKAGKHHRWAGRASYALLVVLVCWCAGVLHLDTAEWCTELWQALWSCWR